MAHKKNSDKLSPYLPVVITNDLARAKYSMELNERRLLYVAMSKISPEDQEFHAISFSVSEYFDLIEKSMGSKTSGRGGKQYEIIKDGCRSLLRRLVEVQDGPSWKVFQWCSKAEFNNDTGTISLKFHDDMKDYLLYMLENKGFTKFLLKYALPLSSIYSQRFYEMFRGLVYPGSGVIHTRVNIPDLKKRLEIDDKYKAYKDFKKRVLQIAEKEINSKTDISISFKEVRENTRGRPIVALKFIVQLKQDMVHEYDKYMLWDKIDLIEKLQELISKAVGQKIYVEDYEKYEHRAIARLVYDISSGEIDLKKIRNSKAFSHFILQKYSDSVGIREQFLQEPKEDNILN